MTGAGPAHFPSSRTGTRAAVALASLAAGTSVVWAADAHGWWWVTAIVGLAAGLSPLPRNASWLVGTGSGILGWGLPLARLATGVSLWHASGAVSALMGIGAPALSAVLTVLIGACLGACGTWLGRALAAMAGRA